MATPRDPQTIPCPRCGEPVYRRAIQCPHCQSNLFMDNDVRTRVISHRVGRAPRSKAAWVAALLLAAAILALGGWLLSRPGPARRAPAASVARGR